MALLLLSDLFFLIIFFAVVLAVQHVKRSNKRYPPGPPGKPLIGNMLDVPTGHSWLVYDEWRRRYDSPIVHAQVLGQSILVLSTLESTIELLDKRSAIYSDRPSSTMLQEILGFSTWNVPLLRYSPFWRLHRKCFNSAFHAREIEAYHHVQLDSVRKLLLGLRESPERFREHINSHAGRVIMKTVYDYDVKPEGDYYVALVEKNFRLFNKAYGNGKFYLVDVFTSLKNLPKWVPGFSFQQIGEELRASSEEMLEQPFEELRIRMANGTAQSCTVVRSIERVKGDLPSEEELAVIKNTAAVAYSAGQDTTASTLASFILAMALQPHQQKKAQAEIDAVTRGVRLPDFNDRDSLPCIRRLMLETMRWRPAVPLGLPHRCVREDEYAGFCIPEGSLVFGNIWSMFHDENVFTNPEEYDADRFLAKARLSKGSKETQEPDYVDQELEAYVLSAVFGFGRRWLAMNTLWITMAQILASYNISKDVNDEGEEVEILAETTDGLTLHPREFKCRFEPRAVAVLQTHAA